MSDLVPVFKALAAILAPYTKKLTVTRNSATELYLDTRHIQKNKKPLFFAAVVIGKRYVSFHLMPVYVDPELLSDLSPALKLRMQGKSCFNFTEVDQAIFKELTRLTKSGFARYKQLGYVK